MAACGKSCPHPRDIELADGPMVCTFCPEWMQECEAGSVLRKPLHTRQSHLREIEKIRGKKAADQLKERMIVLHAIMKRNR